MNAVLFIVAIVAGAFIDRMIVMDKTKAIAEERKYHLGTIRNLQYQLQRSNMERFAAEKARDENTDPRSFIYVNPDFESDFARFHRAKTRIETRKVPRGTPRNGEN